MSTPEFEADVLDYIEHPDYYAGVYDAMLVVVYPGGADDDYGERMATVAPQRVYDIEHEPQTRSHYLDATDETGDEMTVRVEYDHTDDPSVTHVMVRADSPLGDDWVPALRWDIEQAQAWGGDQR